MKECVDEGTLQAWLDGELGPEQTAAMAAHLASCPACTRAVRAAENENLLLSAALEPEFAERIPTERLRQRVEAAIAEPQIAGPARSAASPKDGWLELLRNLFLPSPQHAFGYAGLAAVIVLSAIVGVIYLKRGEVFPVAQNQPAIAQNQPDKPAVVPASEASPAAVSLTPETGPVVKPSGPIAPGKKVAPQRSSGGNPASSRLLPGERNYVNRIAALDKSLKSNAPMRPSLQVEYEHNVAVLDSAIEMTRDAVKKNPKDTEATRFMFAAYQSKVDLLNQVADARRFNTQK